MVWSNTKTEGVDMKDKRMKVGVLFGGRSAEHEVSVQSAASVARAIDTKKFEVIPIGISKRGRWAVYSIEVLLECTNVPENMGTEVVLLPDPRAQGLMVRERAEVIPVEVYFPLLHGPLGEDGSIQGLFELADVPYVGTGVLGSAVGMDKPTMKALFRQAGLPVPPYKVYFYEHTKSHSNEIAQECAQELGFPLFVKPAALGSSIGITKVSSREEMDNALTEAAQYGHKVIVEQAIENAQEVEVAILGNAQPRASVPGEVRPTRAFYDYIAKYTDGQSEILIPSPLAEDTQEKLRHYAIQAFQVVDACGLARVDFLIGRKTEEIYLSEINTLPGFTIYSMYPMLWEASGLKYNRLIEQLINFALERHAEKHQGLLT